MNDTGLQAFNNQWNFDENMSWIIQSLPTMAADTLALLFTFLN